MRKGRKFLATLLTFACLMATSMSVMAAEPQATPEVVTEAVEAGASVARSASGYAADYTDYNVDSFYIDVSGSSSSKGKATMKAWDFPGAVEVYVTLYRPDGTVAFSDVKLTVGQQLSKTFSNFQTGKYRLAYTVIGVYKGWVNCNLTNA